MLILVLIAGVFLIFRKCMPSQSKIQTYKVIKGVAFMINTITPDIYQENGKQRKHLISISTPIVSVGLL